MKFEEIKPYPKNTKKHPQKQLMQIAMSIKEFGWQQPIVVDKKGIIIVGHGRYFAYQKFGESLGLPEPEVKITELSEDQARAYRIADNKLNESDWDEDILIEELKQLEASLFALTGFEEDIITDSDVEDDEIPELPTKAKSRLGEMYALGEHIIMCGNSTSEDDVNRLMGEEKAQMCFTDPPYNIDYKGGMSTHKQNKRDGIMNDKMSDNHFYEFLSDISKRIVENVKGGVYICMSSSELPNLKKAWENNGGHWQSFIIWVKNNFTLSRADYQNTYEPMLYGWAGNIKNHYFIDRRDIANVWEDLRDVKTEFDGQYTSIKFQGFEVRVEGKAKGFIKRKKQRTDIWRYDKPTVSKEHPTMKPVALCLEAVKNSSQKDDIVLDLFGGSGSTLIACEKSGRKCRMMELDPKYIDVIIERWEKFTGQKAERIK